jgi:hypothetical protein
MSLSNQTDKKRLIINSEINRNSQSRDNFSIFLDNPMPHLRNKIRFAVQKAIIPNTAYSVHPQESKLYYVVDPNGPSEELKHISLDTKKVLEDPTDLADEMSLLFDNNGETIDVVVEDTSKKLKFTNNSGQTIKLLSSEDWISEWNGNPLPDRANNKIGLSQDMTSVVLVNGGSTTSKHIPKIQNTMIYHLVSQRLVDNATSITPDKDIKPHVLISMLNTGSWGSNLTTERPENMLWSISTNSDFDQLDIQVLDDKFRPVDLNGAPIFLEIDLEYE